MPRNYFTDEQVEELKNNPYVLKVSKANVSFTDEFRTKYLLLINSGFSPKKAFIELGLDYKMFGECRVDNLVNRLRHPKESTGKKRGRPKKDDRLTSGDVDQILEYYKEYTTRLEQEVELLKKVRALESNQVLSRAKNSK